MWTVVALTALVAQDGCRHRAGRPSQDATPPAAVPGDSIEGIVRVVGVEASPQTVLSLDDGSPALRLSGSALLSRVAGLRVAVVGRREGLNVAVLRFVVVGANGVAAADGRLVAHGDTLTLVTSTGALVVRFPPAGLRAAVLHRVWIAGPLDATIVAYGIIE